ncbi:MAG: TrkA family potassium uptake protein [Tissierellia bacterium]|nr:TrkA family potassium uptake protein [Tissierellia bacterium]
MKSFVVIGCGRFGSTVATTLTELGNEVLAVDESYEKVNDISDEVTTAVQCNIMDEGEVEDLGLKNFDVAIVAIGSNIEASIMATIMAKEAGIEYILCKALTKRMGSILLKLGADNIIYPERDMALRVAHNLTKKNILDYIQISPDFSLMETKPLPSWVGKSIEQLDIRNKYGVTIVAIERGKDVIVSPYAGELLKSDDVVVILGPDDKVKDLEEKND